MKRLLLWVLVSIVYCNTVAGQNQPPNAANDFYTGIEDFPIPVNPLGNDNDPDGNNLSWTVITGPFNGILDTVFGQIVYRPDQNYFGPDFILYRACDDGSPVRCDVATMFINVTNVNDLPVANNDTFSVNEDIPSTLNVLQNDDDIDNDPLTITLITQPPQHGTATIAGNSILYTPDADYNGTDEFRYRVCDTTAGFFPSCDGARVFISVKPINDRPLAQDDSLTIDFTTGAGNGTINVLLNDSDKEGDSISLIKVIYNGPLSYSFTTEGEIAIADSNCIDAVFTCVVCDYSLCDTSLLVIKSICPDVDTTIASDVFLPEGFSPNGDGINDLLQFAGSDVFKPLVVQVFNRYGNLIYENNDYQNDWNGTFKDEPVPDGTYYYYLKLNDGRERKNFLIIQR